MEISYQILADVVLLIHSLFVVFIIIALFLTIVGGFRQWLWIRNRCFRVLHLVGVGVVVVQSCFGILCPLTTLEMWLRSQTAARQYGGSFIHYWFERFLYYNAPEWVFTVVYTAFSLLVINTWVRFPPQKSSRTERHST